MDNNIGILIVAAVVAAGIVISYFVKKRNRKEFSPLDYLKENAETIKALFSMTIDTYKLDRTQYKSEDEYFDAIASMVYREIELEAEGLFGYEFNLVPRDVLIDFISDLLQRDFKHLLTYEKTDEIAEDQATETLIPEETDNTPKMVNIFDHIRE